MPKLHVHFLWLHWLILIFVIFLRLTFSFLTTYFPLELRKRWCWRIKLIIGLSLSGHHYSSETHIFKTSRSFPPTNGPAFGGLMEQVSYIFSHLSVWFHVRCFSNKFQLIFTQDRTPFKKLSCFLPDADINKFKRLSFWNGYLKIRAKAILGMTIMIYVKSFFQNVTFSILLHT